MDLFTTSGILHGRAGFFEHTPIITSTHPIWLPDGGCRWNEKLLIKS